MSTTNTYKFRKREHGYPVAILRTRHGQYEVFDRGDRGDFMVKYWEEITDMNNIKTFEKLGTFPTIEDVDSAIEKHDHAARGQTVTATIDDGAC